MSSGNNLAKEDQSVATGSSPAVAILDQWYKVADSSAAVPDGGRLHARVNGRFVTLFRNRGSLSCIDSICHHAGGPLTLGPLQDIEELHMTVVLCPWHKFMVSIDGGVKAYQGVDFARGKPVQTGWKTSKIVQRPHKVIDSPMGIYVVRSHRKDRIVLRFSLSPFLCVIIGASVDG